MLFKDQLDFVMQHIRKNKMRVFTTILATTMGCAFLIVLASVAFGLQDTIKDGLLSNDSLTKIEVYTNEDDEVNIADTKKIENVSAVISQTSLDAIESTVSIGERTGNARISTSNLMEMKEAKIPLSSGHYTEDVNSMIVGYNLAEALLTAQEKKDVEKAVENEEEKPKVGLQQSLLGKTLSIKWTDPTNNKVTVTKKFKVAGITEKPKREWDLDETIVLNEAAGISLIKEFTEKFSADFKPKENLYTSIYVYATDLEAVKAVNKILKNKGYSTYTVSEQLDQINLFFTVVKAGLIFIGTIAVLIASIGIFNTMTMAVSERTREIGVMKAIGASPKLIQRLFVMESAYIGIVGTVIAIIISYVISITANFAIPFILKAVEKDSVLEEQKIVFSAIPWELVLIASVISIGVAIISGWRPARKATKIDVIDALRRD